MGSFVGSILLSDDQTKTISATKTHPLGTRGYTRDGRVFRYAKAGGTALKAGLLCQAAVPIAAQSLLTSGTTEIKANTESISVVHNTTELFTTANSFADGYLVAETSSTAKGAGQMVQIKSHTAVATTASAVAITLQPGSFFYSATTNFGTTAIELACYRNPWDAVVVKPAGNVTAAIVGVPVRPVTANYYFWIQTWGDCPVKMNGTTPIGYSVGASSGATAGIVDGVNSTKPTSGAASLTWRIVQHQLGVNVGIVRKVGVAGEFKLIFLKIAP